VSPVALETEYPHYGRSRALPGGSAGAVDTDINQKERARGGTTGSITFEEA
jgi:hypothetical protein